jgi:hypothetical protein
MPLAREGLAGPAKGETTAMQPSRARLALAIRTLRVTYADAARTLERESPGQIGNARRHALRMLASVAVEVQPEQDPELVKLLEEARREILGLDTITPRRNSRVIL